jgi:hypothetical protein
MKRMKNITLEFYMCADGTYISPMLLWPSVRDDEIYKNESKHQNIWIKHEKKGI